MSVRLRDVLMSRLDELRHEPIDKRIRGTLGGDTVVDSTRALLVWEPKRIVPSYAVPAEDVQAEIVAAAGVSADAAEADAPVLMGRRVQRVELTDEGGALFDRLRKVAMAHDARLRSQLSNAETEQLATLLDKLAAGVSEPAPVRP